ncbi:MAG: zinc ribbon domain-containing protein [Sandaracinaceae bacterium]|nr:zinc ribbon domain-containing protein [Sandaracinaceae bacterium]
MTIYCPSCGKPNTDEASNCISCGTELAKKKAARFKGTMMMSGPGALPGAPASAPPPAAPAAPPAAAPGASQPPAAKKDLAFQKTMLGPMTAPPGVGAPGAPAPAFGALRRRPRGRRLRRSPQQRRPCGRRLRAPPRQPLLGWRWLRRTSPGSRWRLWGSPRGGAPGWWLRSAPRSSGAPGGRRLRRASPSSGWRLRRASSSSGWWLRRTGPGVRLWRDHARVVWRRRRLRRSPSGGERWLRRTRGGSPGWWLRR